MYKVYRAGFVYYGTFGSIPEARRFAASLALTHRDTFMVWSVAGANIIEEVVHNG
jgi:hypothetical protein